MKPSTQQRLGLAFSSALALGACSALPAPPNASDDMAILARAAELAALQSKPTVISSAKLTPARPRDASAALIAGARIGIPDPSGSTGGELLWDPTDGASGSVAFPGSNHSHPASGPYIGIRFEARVGLRYLAHCMSQQAGGRLNYIFGPDPSGSGRVELNAADFAIVSDRTAANGQATLIFANEQGGHKLVACNLLGLKD
jgi:hypothetical protein